MVMLWLSINYMHEKTTFFLVNIKPFHHAIEIKHQKVLSSNLGTCQIIQNESTFTYLNKNRMVIIIYEASAYCHNKKNWSKKVHQPSKTRRQIELKNFLLISHHQVSRDYKLEGRQCKTCWHKFFLTSTFINIVFIIYYFFWINKFNSVFRI